MDYTGILDVLIGEEGEKMHKDIVIKVSGMSCINCEKKVERAVSVLPGVGGCKADYSNTEVAVNCEDKEDTIQAVKAAITGAGFKVME